MTRHGRPAAVLIGFEDDEDWFDYLLEHDPRFIARMEAARRSLDAGLGISIEQARKELGLAGKPRARRAPSGKPAAAPKRATGKKRSR